MLRALQSALLVLKIWFLQAGLQAFENQKTAIFFGGFFVISLVMSLTDSRYQFLSRILEQTVSNSTQILVFEKLTKIPLSREITFSNLEINEMASQHSENVSFLVRVTDFGFGVVDGFVAVFWFYYLFGGALVVSLLLYLPFLPVYLHFEAKQKKNEFRQNRLFEKIQDLKAIESKSNDQKTHQDSVYHKSNHLEGVETHKQAKIQFFTKIKELTEKQTTLTHKTNKLRILLNLTQEIAQIAFLVTLFLFQSERQPMTLKQALTAIILIETLIKGTSSLLCIKRTLKKAEISSKKILLFLLSENLDSSYIKKQEYNEALGNVAISIKNGNFYWLDPDLENYYKSEKKDLEQYQVDQVCSKKRQSIPQSDQDSARKSMLSLRSKVCTMSRKDAESLLSEPFSQTFRSETVRLSSRKSEKFMNSNSNFGEDIQKTNKKRVETSPGGDQDARDHAQGLSNQIFSLYKGISIDLKNINLGINRGDLVAVIGAPHSGKSSLLRAIFGQMHHIPGSEVEVFGEAAYLGLESIWMLDGSVKDNILFGMSYIHKKYMEMIRFSGLSDDYEKFDFHKRGRQEGAENDLDDGLKVKICLARALYSKAEIFIFDQIFDFLTPETRDYLVEETVLDYLDGYTRIVVTDSFNYLDEFDQIIIMEEGKIALSGSYLDIKDSHEFLRVKKRQRVSNFRGVDIAQIRRRAIDFDDLNTEICQFDANEPVYSEEAWIKNRSSVIASKLAGTRRQEWLPSYQFYSGGVSGLLYPQFGENGHSASQYLITDLADISGYGAQNEDEEDHDDRIQGSQRGDRQRVLSFDGGFSGLVNWSLLVLIFLVYALINIGVLWFLDYWVTEVDQNHNSKHIIFGYYFGGILALRSLFLLMGRILICYMDFAKINQDLSKFILLTSKELFSDSRNLCKKFKGNGEKGKEGGQNKHPIDPNTSFNRFVDNKVRICSKMSLKHQTHAVVIEAVLRNM